MDMQRLIAIIDETPSELLMEGNNHKVSLPVRMAIEHYAKPELAKYISDASDEINTLREARTQSFADKARYITQKIRVKEGTVDVQDMYNTKSPKKDRIDTVRLDIPLLIRLFEYAREDARDDVDIHKLADNLIKLSRSGPVLTMTDYKDVIPR